jgi:photosystem II stability/assembly factor-like uncharacterized protein
MVADPLHGGTVYVAFDNLEGVFKTTDGGATWAGVGGQHNADIDVLAIDPSRPDVLYSGSYEGIKTSTDGGHHWSSLGFSEGIRAIAVDPSDSRKVFAGGDQLWRTTDAGTTWTTVNTPGDGISVSSITFDPKHPQVVYAAGTRFGRVRPGIIKSSDGGSTWETLHAGLSRWAVLDSIVLDPLRPHTVYLAARGQLDTTRHVAGVLKSSDAGHTWTSASVGLPRRGVRAIAAGVTAGDTVLLAGTRSGPFLSHDRGGRWFPENDGLRATVVRSLAVDPDDPSRVFAGLDAGGLYRSTDGTRSWERAGRGIPRDTTVAGIDIAPSDPQTVYALANDVLYASLDGGRTWAKRSGPLLLGGSLRVLVVSPSHSAVLYLGSGNTGRQILKSTDGGFHWATAIAGLPYPVGSLVIDPAMPWILHAGTAHGVFTTRSAGGDWHRDGGPEAPSSAGPLAIDPEQPATIYAVGGAFVFKTTDRGKTWARYDPRTFGDVSLTSIAVDPGEPSLVYLGTDEYFAEGGLKRSGDGGMTWTWVEGVPAPITRLAIGRDRVIHVGTSGHAVVSGPSA